MSDRKSIYIGPELARLIAAHGCQSGELSGLVNQTADRFLEVVRRHLPALSTAEWCLLCDALNGYVAQPAALGVPGLVLSVTDAIALDGLAEKWQVAAPDLLSRLEALPFAGLLAVLDLAERFWACHADRPAPEVIDELLRAAGRQG